MSDCWEDAVECIYSGALCLARYPTAVWILTDAEDVMLLHDKEKSGILQEMFDRVKEGFKTLNCTPRQDYTKLPVRSAIQLELHQGYVCVRSVSKDRSVMLFQNDKQNRCLGFYVDLKVGFELAGFSSRICTLADEHCDKLAANLFSKVMV